MPMDVQLGLLIPRSDKVPNRLVIDSTNLSNPIQAQPMAPRKIRSIEEWTDLFLSFVAIYCTPHLGQAREEVESASQTQKPWRKSNASNTRQTYKIPLGL